ncbi:MAG: hypothetical protein DRO16_02110 [Thermoprotei archaeon]|nr:MAG: hypothetical protein DRO16_02110 [Thermoprotei archaeon]
MSNKILILIVLILSCGILTGAEKYAVLITGDFADDQGNFNGSWAVANGLSAQNPMEEFWHDTFLMWEMLLEKGYDNDNIYVLYADGSDCDENYIIEGGRYIPEIHDFQFLTDYSASLANVEMVLEGLAFGNVQQEIPQLQDDDFLTIWTFGHGAVHDNHNWLSLYNGNEISDEDFGDLVGQINSQKKVIFMQQCYSGGFKPYLEAEDTIILTAANDNMYAFQEDAIYYDGITPGTSTPGTHYTADERDVWAGPR